MVTTDGLAVTCMNYDFVASSHIKSPWTLSVISNTHATLVYYSSQLSSPSPCIVVIVVVLLCFLQHYITLL